MRGIFQKNSKKGQKNVEKDKIEILGKNVLNFNIFLRRAGDHVQLLHSTNC